MKTSNSLLTNWNKRRILDVTDIVKILSIYQEGMIVSEFNNLKLEVENEIAVLTISRPGALNALNSETLDELNTALTEIEARDDVKVVRAMPNTPALIGEGMSALCANDLVTAEELTEVKSFFDSFGKSEIVPESLMDAVVGVSGSSPAYVYLFIEAMADAAVADGMPRSQAYKFAAQSVLGAAKMVLETGKHPGELKDAVCSPGGTTIEAVQALEAGGFRNTVITAQRTCSKKSHDMSKEA